MKQVALFFLTLGTSWLVIALVLSRECRGTAEVVGAAGVGAIASGVIIWVIAGLRRKEAA